MGQLINNISSATTQLLEFDQYCFDTVYAHRTTGLQICLGCLFTEAFTSFAHYKRVHKHYCIIAPVVPVTRCSFCSLVLTYVRPLYSCTLCFNTASGLLFTYTPASIIQTLSHIAINPSIIIIRRERFPLSLLLL